MESTWFPAPNGGGRREVMAELKSDLTTNKYTRIFHEDKADQPAEEVYSEM